MIIAIVFAGFQGSVLVKHFTRFTKDIFAGFVATVFIYEALLQTFGVSLPCNHLYEDMFGDLNKKSNLIFKVVF